MTTESTIEVISDDDEDIASTSFDAVVKIIHDIHTINGKGKPYWYQLIYGSRFECFENVGTIHHLLGLDEKKTIEIFKSAGLLYQKTNTPMSVNNKKFIELAGRLSEGSQFKASDLVTFTHGRGRNTFLLVGCPSDGKVCSLKDQLRKKEAPPDLSIPSIQRNFQLVPCIARIVSGDAADAASLTNFNQSETYSNELEQTISICVDEDHLSDGWKRPCPSEEEKSRKRQRRFRLTDCNGQTVQCPNGYKLVHKTKKRNSEEALERQKAMLGAVKKKEHRLSLAIKLCLGTCAANFPQVSNAAAEQFLMQGVLIALSVVGLTDIEDMENAMVSFDSLMDIKPSNTTVHNHVVKTAAHKVVLMGDRMEKASRVYVAVDHGAGVLAKIAYFYDKQMKKIMAVNLDFDTSGDSAMHGAVATKHSLKKYVYAASEEELNEKLKGMINGGASDSGGGFTKDAMRDTLNKVGIACLITWIGIACTAHNDQTNLRHSMDAVYGLGGLDERTVAQLIHAYSDYQKACRDKSGTRGLKELLTKAYIHVKKESPPAHILKELHKQMQEPILTRWKTVGMALQYIAMFFSILVAAVKASNGSKNNPKNSQLGKTGANFVSLANEQAIVCDVAFLAHFDKRFFNGHFEFNHATDPNIGRSAFLAPHHLVRYFLKDKDLGEIKAELDSGSLSRAPADPKFSLFWEHLHEFDMSKDKATEEQEDCLGKARRFIEEYTISLDKHNNQFCKAPLLFLAVFGEQKTSEIVAKFLVGEDLKSTIQQCANKSHYSTLHKRHVALDEFANFVSAKCSSPEARRDCVKSKNFMDFEPTIKRIANGYDFWGAPGEEAEELREKYLANFGAIPSTTEDVERVVKRARLCQKTGKEERSVTIYGIAGDGVSRECTDSLIHSEYHGNQKEKRDVLIAKAVADGKKPREPYKPDLERGPGMVLNICNHAMVLKRDGEELAKVITPKVFEDRLKMAEKYLKSYEKQGSKLRCDEAIENAVASLGKDYTPSAREMISGVGKTPAMRNEVVLNKCTLGADPSNKHAMFDEALERGIVNNGHWEDYNSKKSGTLNFQQLRKKISEYEVAEWQKMHSGEIPIHVGKAIKLRSKTYKLVAKRT